jgi:hypothetical protein
VVQRSDSDVVLRHVQAKAHHFVFASLGFAQLELRGHRSDITLTS